MQSVSVQKDNLIYNQLLNSLSSMLLDLELPIPASQTSINSSGLTCSIIFQAKFFVILIAFSSQYAKHVLFKISHPNSSANNNRVAMLSGVIVSVKLLSQSSFNPKKIESIAERWMISLFAESSQIRIYLPCNLNLKERASSWGAKVSVLSTWSV